MGTTPSQQERTYNKQNNRVMTGQANAPAIFDIRKDPEHLADTMGVPGKLRHCLSEKAIRNLAHLLCTTTLFAPRNQPH